MIHYHRASMRYRNNVYTLSELKGTEHLPKANSASYFRNNNTETKSGAETLP